MMASSQPGSVFVPFVSYAQNFEDVMLWRALRSVPDGFYIDAGASYPNTDSVTRAFYEHGWRGINIEPLPAPAANLRLHRPRDINLALALDDTPGRRPFFAVLEGDPPVAGGLSTLDPATARDHAARGYWLAESEVETSTLTAICDRHVQGPIHFLKIDVEGCERAVLAGADFVRYRPWIVVVEATRPASPEPAHAAWEGLLSAADYRMVWNDGLNRFYAAAEHHGALAPHFVLPPNVFDDFVRLNAGDAAYTAQLAAELMAARAELAELRAGRDRGPTYTAISSA